MTYEEQPLPSCQATHSSHMETGTSQNLFMAHRAEDSHSIGDQPGTSARSHVTEEEPAVSSADLGALVPSGDGVQGAGDKASFTKTRDTC